MCLVIVMWFVPDFILNSVNENFLYQSDLVFSNVVFTFMDLVPLLQAFGVFVGEKKYRRNF